MAINKENTWVLKQRKADHRIMLLLVLGIFLQTGCLRYNHASLSYHGMQQLKGKQVQLYLIDNEHVLTEVWALKSYRLDKNEISCKIEHLHPSTAREEMMLKTPQSARKKRNHIHLFATPALVQQLQAADSVTFDYHLLDRVDVSELDVDQTIFRTLGFLLFLGLAGFAAILLVVTTIFSIF